MSYLLERIWERRRSELQKLDIEIRASQNLVVTAEKVIRFGFYATSSQVERAVSSLIKEATAKKAEDRKRRQLTLFEEKK
jgi:hypothetical protein